MRVPSPSGIGADLMAADEYRRLAAECLRIAEDVINSQSRNLLIHMSQSWLRLAHQYEHNLAPPAGRPRCSNNSSSKSNPRKTSRAASVGGLVIREVSKSPSALLAT